MKPGRLISPPGTYFVTASTWQRRRLFQSEQLARLFLVVLYRYRRQSCLLLHAFVLMPEHFHLILTPKDITLERAMQLIKGGYSHEVGITLSKKLEIWERGFTDHRIRDEEDFVEHVKYILSNPVRRGLVREACEYRYCSAFPGFKLDRRPSAAESRSLVEF